MLVKRSSMLPENGRSLDWERLEGEASDLADLASAVAAFGSKVPPSAATVRRWQELSTVALVALAQAGHREAFDPLYRRYSAGLVRYATRLAYGDRELGEDIASQTWATAVADIARFDPREGNEDGFVRWLYAVTKRSSWPRLRYAALESTFEHIEWFSEDDRLAQPQACDGDTATRVQVRAWIREVVASMPQKMQRVAWLKLDGLSTADIAAQLGCTEASVACHWNRFCDRCKASAGGCPVQVERKQLDGDLAKLRDAAQKLAPAPRRVVLLRLDGLTCREIAEQLGRSLGGVQNYCYQARKTFAAQGLAFK